MSTEPEAREKIPIHVVNGRGFIYDVEVIKYLREVYHICGVLSGTLPQFPQQNIFGGLPLQLLPEDVEYLLQTEKFFLVDDKTWHINAKTNVQEPDIVQGNLAVIPTSSKASQPIIPSEMEPVKYIKPTPERYYMYRYLMERGFFIMPGLRFGCQFMAYPGDLMRYHSHYNVLGYGWDEPFPILDIVAGGRLATSVKKCWIVGAAAPDTHNMSVFSIEWAGFG